MPAQVAANRSNPVGDARYAKLATNLLTFRRQPKHAHQLRSRHPDGDSVDCRITYSAVMRDKKDRGFGDTASLAWVQDAPSPDKPPFCVAKNWKRQVELPPDGFGFCRFIDRDGRYACAGSVESVVIIAVLRQLAEAERSSVATVEQQHSDAWRNKFGQPPRDTPRVSQLEIRHDVTRRRYLFTLHALQFSENQPRVHGEPVSTAARHLHYRR
jgi:hypothetical protein